MASACRLSDAALEPAHLNNRQLIDMMITAVVQHAVTMHLNHFTSPDPPVPTMPSTPRSTSTTSSFTSNDQPTPPMPGKGGGKGGWWGGWEGEWVGRWPEQGMVHMVPPSPVHDVRPSQRYRASVTSVGRHPVPMCLVGVRSLSRYHAADSQDQLPRNLCAVARRMILPTRMSITQAMLVAEQMTACGVCFPESINRFTVLKPGRSFPPIPLQDRHAERRDAPPAALCDLPAGTAPSSAERRGVKRHFGDLYELDGKNDDEFAVECD